MARFSQAFLQALTKPSYSDSLFDLGKGLAQTPAVIRQEEERKAKQEQLMSIIQSGTEAVGANDPTSLASVAQQLAKIPGMEKQAIEFAQLAQQSGAEIAQSQKEEEALNARRNAIATSAEANSLFEVAARARRATSHDTLDEIAKDLRQAEIKKVGEMPVPLRRKLAQAAGVSSEEFDDLGLGTVSDEAFNNYTDGLVGDLQPWMDQNGDIKVYRTSKYATVYDESSKSFVNPGDLGLKEAPPSVQKVETIAQGLQEKLTDLGAENFKDLSTQAVQSGESIRSIDRVLPTLDNMYTGTLAEMQLKTAKLFNKLGIPLGDLSRITDTEVFIAESGKRVADYIKALGSGTGLSDKDLKFTQQVVGGEIGVDASSLRKILEEFRAASVRKIKGYNDMRTNVFKRMGSSSDASLTEAFYPSVVVPSASPAGSGGVLSTEDFLKLSPEEQEEYLKSKGV